MAFSDFSWGENAYGLRWGFLSSHAKGQVKQWSVSCLSWYLVSCPCHGYSWLLQVKTSKMAETINTVCIVKIQTARCPAARSLGKRLTFESEILTTHGFLVRVSAMRTLYVWCTFSWSSPKTKQQNKYLLSCFLKHKEASKGKFKQGLVFSPTCMFCFFLSFFFFLS